MEKKIWSNPGITSIGVENTEFGGDTFVRVDGPYTEKDGKKYWSSAS